MRKSIIYGLAAVLLSACIAENPIDSYRHSYKEKEEAGGGSGSGENLFAGGDGSEGNPYILTMPYEDVHISARMSIPYIDADGQTAYCTNYTILTGSTEYSSYGEDGVEAWYVVDHDVTYTDDVSFSGTANLILVDGATLTLNPGNSGSGITMSTSDNFNIYVQSAGTGAIIATDANIGASDNLTIYGGHISLTSVAFDACYLYSYDDLTINGGQITIESNERCICTYSDKLTINGGTLNGVRILKEDTVRLMEADQPLTAESR